MVQFGVPLKKLQCVPRINSEKRNRIDADVIFILSNAILMDQIKSGLSDHI